MPLEARDIFRKNLNYYLNKAGKNQNDLCVDLNLTSSTVSDWVLGKKYPRVDKMQMLADYFNIKLSDLREERDEAKLTNDEELQNYLEELKNRSEMRMLFKLSSKATKEEVEQAVKIIEALRKK